MNYSINKFFHFKGYFVQKIESNDLQTIIHLMPRRKTARCPKCSKRSNTLYENGDLRKVKHSRYEGKPVSVLVPKRRFFCKCCALPFSEQIDWISFKERTTDSFSTETISALRNSSFSAIQEMYATSYQFLSKNLKGLDMSVPWPKGELILGFDEHSYAKRHMMVTITELKTKTLLAILPHYSKEVVIEYLSSRTEEEMGRVLELCFDMKFKQRKTAESFFPKASTVVDKFHVLSYLTSLIDSDRKIIAPKITSFENIRQIMRRPEGRLNGKEKAILDAMFAEHPDLKERWLIYQKLSRFYRLKSKEEAGLCLQEIKRDLSALERSYTRNFLGTLGRLEEEILNYFDNRTTNAFTEGVHTKIKMIKRTSFGFRNVEIYIKKVMLAFIPLTIILDQFLPH